MEIIVVLLPLALALGATFVGLFIWAVSAGQYEDVETPKYRMLLEDKTGSLNQKKGNEL
jgi:cbb3-type cytochrome oxidase maturation protein